ncbi:hypothetical protein UZ962_27575, partial [Escherichia coli]|nr:hypothetical protein [Escherichia coli]MDY9213563.1 hypothetical protein [Escherichia coli]MDY9268109.1 hypothetical protein [Escherichia coli]MDY9322863.1 hypothetical protein [Escherichia coli]MDY9327996.1 hypothetical protein [Escherichia coli]
ILGRPFSSFLAVFFGSLTGRFEGLPRIKCRRGGVFGGADIIGFTYQSFNHIPKKSFRTCGDARKGQAAVLSSQSCRDLTRPSPTDGNCYQLMRSRAVFAL